MKKHKSRGPTAVNTNQRFSSAPNARKDGVDGSVMATKHPSAFDPKLFLAKIGDGRDIGKYRKDQIVFSQGDPADAVFYVQKGKVKLTVVSEQGKEAIIAILGADEFFGEGCLAGQALRIATVRTLMDSVIARLEKAAIIQSDSSGAGVLRKIYRPPSEPQYPRRSGSGRSTV